MKKMKNFLFLFLFPMLLFAQKPSHDKKVIGYYAQWAIYARDFNVSKIDGSKLTHLMYAFFGTEFDPANPQGAKLKSLDSYADFEHTEGGAPWDATPKGNFYDLKKLKEKYPHLKVLVSVGGWTKSQGLCGIAASSVGRTAFAKNMADFLVTYPFIDGFDIDWEFPVVGGIDGTEVIGGITPPAQPHTPDDNKNLVYLLKAMREAMPNKVISIAAGNNVVNVPKQFIGPGNKAQYGMTDDITTYCDFITFFGYDFGGPWYDKTCYNAPLYGSGNSNDPLNTSNESLDHLTNIYLNTLAIPNNKLVMGIPFYGKIFDRVANNGTIPSLPGLFVSAPRTTGSCVNPQAPQGTWDAGSCEFTGSIEFCDIAGSSGTTGHHYLDPSNPVNISSSGAGWTRYWDDTAKVPYLYNSGTKQFITYDDKKSIDEKAKYIASKNLGGAMIWELSQDTRPGSPEPAALLGQINTTFSGVTPPPPTYVTVKVAFKDQSNVAISGVSTALKKTSDNTTITVVSDANGNVQFPNTATSLGYTVSFTKNLYNFVPQTITIASGSLTADTSYNVVGSTQTISTYAISGTVKNGTTGISGATVSLTSNGVTTTSTTNASGVYTFANLASGQNYLVATSNAGQTFSPASATFNNLSANQTQDFTLSVSNGYLISGTVKNGTVPAAGVKVNLVLPYTNETHGWVELSALSDAQGNYHFENTAISGYATYSSLKINGWENKDVVYLPSYPQANLPTSPQVFNFNTQTVVTPTYYTVSGTVKNGATAISGVTITATSGGNTLTAVSDANGAYSVANLVAGADYTVTAAKSGQTFTPASTIYTAISANKTLDFALVFVTPTFYTVSGTVKNGSTAISGVTVTATSGANTLTAVSDANGAYSIANLVAGADYTVTAAKSGQSFTPASTVYTAISANKTLNFALVVVTPTYYTVSGTIKNGSTAISGVTVSATSGGNTLTAVSDANGAYSVANLVSGSDYTVTAAKTGLTFTPVSTVYSAISANKTLNFTQNVTNGYLISGTVKNGAAPVAGVKVDLVLPYTNDTHGWVDLSTLSDAQGNYHFENAAISGYVTYSSLKINAWENKDVVYSPSYPGANLPTSPQVFNFNTQTVVATTPVVAITAPTASAISLNLGSAVNFVASVGLSASDATTISSVVFSLDGQNLSTANSSGNYTASWTPVANQFSGSHTLTVTATASNGTTDVKTYSFTLNCSGANCPNQLPVITWNSPSNTTVSQSSFQVVPISVTAVDNDGSVSGVTITINGGTFNMSAGSNNTYTYNFTPSAYQAYTVVIKATDNRSGLTTLNNTLTITKPSSNRFIPLPSKIILGYAHSWENSSAPFLYFSQMVGSKFNVVDYSFIETVNRDGYTPVLTTNDTRYLSNGIFNKQLLKNDIKTLRDSGVPVIISIGGQNGHVVLDNVAQKNTFVNGLKAIIDEYQFDGVDLDFEGGSMNFNAGSLRDISYAGISAYPRLKNIVDACKELKAYYGPGFLLTAAPETQYVQGGYSSYSDTYGSFLPIIQNLRNEIDLLAVQLYNTGGENGLDGRYYGSGTRANMVTALTDMLVKGYNIGTTGMHFDGLPPSKILIGLPACPSAAGSGFLPAAEAVSALHYLRTGTTFLGRTYTLQPGGPYPALRGLMTWSVNWDFSSCGNSSEFSKGFANYFATQSAKIATDKIAVTSNSTIVYFKNNALSVTNEVEDIAQVEVYNIAGKSVVNYNNVGRHKEVLLENNSFMTKQMFIVVVTDGLGNKKSFKVLNFLN
jgi:GH18 family chitinase